jgi:hypothetical protein
MKSAFLFVVLASVCLAGTISPLAHHDATEWLQQRIVGTSDGLANWEPANSVCEPVPPPNPGTPEPETVWLMGTGLVLLGASRLHRRRPARQIT